MFERDLGAEFPGPQRIVEVITRGARQFGDRELIVTPGARMTFGDLYNRRAVVDRAMYGSPALHRRRIARSLQQGAAG